MDSAVAVILRCSCSPWTRLLSCPLCKSGVLFSPWKLLDEFRTYDFYVNAEPDPEVDSRWAVRTRKLERADRVVPVPQIMNDRCQVVQKSENCEGPAVAVLFEWVVDVPVVQVLLAQFIDKILTVWRQRRWRCVTNNSNNNNTNNNNNNTIWRGSVFTGEEPPLCGVESCSPASRRPNPIPAIPPYVVRTPHLHWSTDYGGES